MSLLCNFSYTRALYAQARVQIDSMFRHQKNELMSRVAAYAAETFTLRQPLVAMLFIHG